MKLAFALALAALLYSCSTQTPLPATEAVTEYPEQELFGAQISFFTEDRLATVIDAGRVLQYEKQNLIILDSGIVADFFDEAGRKRTRIWADSGTASEATRNLNAFGHVIAVSDSGERLETEILRYDHSIKMIRADGPVKISTPTDTIYGTGFIADRNLKNWTIEQPEGRTFRDRPSHAQPDSTQSDSLAQ